ncbi:HNH endonuclease [Achromobacter spanius]|uniref:HNH endonuclease n=1 Tax=Achromobacter spanius TaxID=217203 RepID=UPI0037F8D9A6
MIGQKRKFTPALNWQENMKTNHASLPAKLTSAEIKRTALEVRQALTAAKADGDVALMDYESEYLKTNRWKKVIKPRILKRDNRICRSCGSSGNIVHHRSYDRDVLEGRNDEMLVTVCAPCHDIIHFEEDGTKRSLADTDAVLFAPKPTEIPEPKIDMRKVGFASLPNKPRMTGYQQKIWREKVLELAREKRAQVDEKKRRRDDACPPAQVPTMTWAELRAWRMKE